MIIVTGANGFVGRTFTRQLDREGLNYRVYQGDINDFARLRFELGEADTVVHLATGEAHGRDRWLAWVDIDGTNALIQASKHARLKHLVIISRLNADPYSHFPLLRAKGIVEEMVRGSGVPYTIMRCSSLFGRHDHFIGSILSSAYKSFVTLPKGGRRPMQPLWINDLGRCILNVIDQAHWRNKTITLAGDERLHYAEIVRAVLAGSNRGCTIMSLPPMLARSVNRFKTTFANRPPITQYAIDRILTGEVAPLDTIPRQFGFRPTRLNDYLSRVAHIHLNRLAPYSF